MFIFFKFFNTISEILYLIINYLKQKTDKGSPSMFMHFCKIVIRECLRFFKTKLLES